MSNQGFVLWELKSNQGDLFERKPSLYFAIVYQRSFKESKAKKKSLKIYFIRICLILIKMFAKIIKLFKMINKYKSSK